MPIGTALQRSQLNMNHKEHHQGNSTMITSALNVSSVPAIEDIHQVVEWRGREVIIRTGTTVG